jgi:hypothetical protein
MIRFAGYRGTSALSRFIRARTGPVPFIVWARYSHFSVVDLKGAREIEAWIPDGVIEGDIGWRHTPGTRVDLYRFREALTPEEETFLWETLQREVGCPYDFKGVFGFLWVARTFGLRHSRLKWFCSELCKSAARKIGRLKGGKSPSRTSPEDLSHEPELVFESSFTVKPAAGSVADFGGHADPSAA